MRKRLLRFGFILGWKLMGIPVGIKGVCIPWMRYGPYRWGAWLHNWCLVRM